MEKYKKAVKSKLRFKTSRGLLTLEQLWDTPLIVLVEAIRKAKEEIGEVSKDDELSFLEENHTVDETMQLRFDILKDVYLSKKKENKERRDEALIKENNEKIMSLIHQKEEEELKNKDIEELKKMIK